MEKNRRDFIRKSTAIAALSLTAIPSVSAAKSILSKGPSKPVQWPLSEGSSTPKIVLGCAANADVKTMRRLKQVGVNHVSMPTVPGPWKETELREILDRFKANGLTVVNIMHAVGINIVLGRDGRDAEIENFKESLRVAGVCGLPTVEYNFYVDRLIEGYFETPGRGGSGVTGYDYSKVKDIPAKPEIGKQQERGGSWRRWRWWLCSGSF